MCGRYASFLSAETLARLFGTVNPLPNLESIWNMAPTKDALRFWPVDKKEGQVLNDGSDLIEPIAVVEPTLL